MVGKFECWNIVYNLTNIKTYKPSNLLYNKTNHQTFQPSYQKMSKTIYSFEKLEVWKEARILVKLIYKYTKSFPKEEIFGLTSQLRRAAISVSSNIAEGAGRKTVKRSGFILYNSLWKFNGTFKSINNFC